MTNDQKIQFGAEVLNKCCEFMDMTQGDPDNISPHFKYTCIKIADFILERVEEIGGEKA